MDKIILRDKKTGKTREINAEKYAGLPPDAKAEIAAVSDIISVPAEQFAEAERLAGKGESGSSLLGSFARGAFPTDKIAPAASSVTGVAAEAAGAGLRDALAALVAGRALGPRAAAAVPTISGAIEGAVASPPGVKETLAGAAIGALTSNIPVPKVIERATGKLAAAGGEAVGLAKTKLKERTAKRAEAEAQKALSEAPPITSDATQRLQRQLDAERAGRQLADEPLDAEAEAVQEAAKKWEKIDTKVAAAEKAGSEADEAAKKAASSAEITAAAAGAGLQTGVADIVRQAPEQAVAAIMADPRLEGRELSTITPSEMWAALKRAVQLITDEDARVRELAIREANK